MALRTEVSLSTAFPSAVDDRARPLVRPPRRLRERSITWWRSGGRAADHGRDDGRRDASPFSSTIFAASGGANRGGE